MQNIDVLDAGDGCDIHSYHVIVLGNELEKRFPNLSEPNDDNLVTLYHVCEIPPSK
jgi:hypothetical protein